MGWEPICVPAERWNHKTPQTRFWVGDESSPDVLKFPYEVGALLFREGFGRNVGAACQAILTSAGTDRATNAGARSSGEWSLCLTV